jgi:hypothetical protein
MKNIIILLLLVFPVCVYSQSGYHITKDIRIQKVQHEVVGFLLKEKQLSVKQPDTKEMSKYLGGIYIIKQIEFYSGCNEMMLINFGALSDHGNNYWGLISKVNKIDTLYILDKEEALSSLSSRFSNCDSSYLECVLFFINNMDARDLIYWH